MHADAHFPTLDKVEISYRLFRSKIVLTYRADDYTLTDYLVLEISAQEVSYKIPKEAPCTYSHIAEQ